MEENSLKSKATKGMFWSAIDKFAVQGGQFIIGIILARILMPTDFGLIGMLSIFIAISQSFIDSGMGSGLIQKKDRTEIDFSTVFVFNFLVSVLFYLVLYICAPFIADFYKMPQLVMITRVLSLNIVINSFAIIQRSKLTINIDFKTLTKANAIAVLIGGISAIFFAYFGWGVWALVAQAIIGALISVIVIWYLSRWKISLRFSKNSFKGLFGYGSKLLLAGIYAQTLNNIYNLAIGKAYTSSDLGFYTRAKAFAEISAGTVTSILQQVTFPILASLQGNESRMISVYSRLIKMTAFFIFPIMVLLSLLADPFVKLLLGENWVPVIVLLQWMCFARIFYPISAINMNILNAVGRSDLFLKVDLSKLPLIVIAMIITIPLGVKAIIIGQVATSVISFFINAYMPGKLFGYGALAQLKDMIPVLFATGVMSLVVFLVLFYVDNSYLKLLLGSLSGLITYGLMAKTLKIEGMEEMKLVWIKIINRK